MMPMNKGKNLSTFYYQVYGLNIESDIEIKEFIKKECLENEEVVRIVLEDVPEEIQQEINQGKGIGFTEEYIWLSIKNTAIYVMYNGKKIGVYPFEGANEQLLRIYIMCSCLGFIMLQRGHVAIHGSGIEIGSNAVIVTGDRGAGKTTLATALREKGYKILADDVVGIKFEDSPMACWGFPYQKLCEDAMERMGYQKEQYESFTGDKKTKYMVGIHRAFLEELRPMQAIIEICKGAVEEVTLEEIRGTEKLYYIIKNIYRGEYIKRLSKLDPIYMKRCLVLAKNIKFYRMTRPEEGFSVEEQIKQINQILLG